MMPLGSYLFLVNEFKRLRDTFYNNLLHHKNAQAKDKTPSTGADPSIETEMECLSDAMFLILQIFAAVASSDTAVNIKLKTELAEAGLLQIVIGPQINAFIMHDREYSHDHQKRLAFSTVGRRHRTKPNDHSGKILPP